MSFSYVDPSNSDGDAVRFLLGDTLNTKEDPRLLEDEEIEWALVESGNDQRLAAAFCAEALQAKFSRKPTSETLGETSITFGNLSMKFGELADRMRNTARQDIAAIPEMLQPLNDRTPIAVPMSKVPEV